MSPPPAASAALSPPAASAALPPPAGTAASRCPEGTAVWLTGVVTDGPVGAGVAGAPAEEPADGAGRQERRTIARAGARVLRGRELSDDAGHGLERATGR